MKNRWEAGKTGCGQTTDTAQERDYGGMDWKVEMSGMNELDKNLGYEMGKTS